MNRDKLDKLTAEQAVAFVYANLIDVSRIQILFPVVVTGLFWGKVSNTLSLFWCVLSIAVYVARIQLTIEYRKQTSIEDPYVWGHYFTITSLASGLLWGLSAFLFDTQQSDSALIFLYVLIVGTAAGASIISSYWMPGYLCFAVPAVLLSGLNLVLRGDTPELVLGVLLFLYLFILVGVSQKTRQSGYDAIRLRFENFELIERLENEKERAEVANRAKTQFLASANHDLRQPVHALSLISYSLKNELVTQRGKELFHQLDHTVGNLNNLLASLLDLSQLDAGALKLELTTVHLNTIAAQLQSEFSSIAKEKNLSLRIHSLDASIQTDHTLILRLIGNLLTNAIRYTETGGVLLGFRRRGSSISVEVWDTGIGIEDSELDEIFNEFYQIEEYKKATDSGLGLGLSICQRIAQMLNTRIAIASKPGVGTVFRFLVPEAPSIVDNAALAGPYQRESLRNAKALVIDDDLMGLNAVAAVLSQYGMEIMLAQSKDRAETLLDESDSPPDFILSDFRLAGELNGVELVDELRRRAGMRNIPAIIMTGDTAKEVLSMLDQCGLPVLNKPVSAGTLLDALDTLLEN